MTGIAGLRSGLNGLVAGSIVVVAAAFAPAAIAAPGKLDRGFSGDGRVTVSVPGWELSGSSYGELARGNDGRVALAGTMRREHGWKVDPVIAVFKANGARNRQFSGDGRKLVDEPGDAGRVNVAVQRGGKILIAVVHDSGSRVVRLRPDGRIDRSFGADGTASIPSVNVHDLAVDGAGRIVVAGSTGTEDRGQDFAAFRLTAGGEPDPGFGVGGLVTVDFHRPDEPNLSFDSAEAVAMRPDGEIVLCGGSDTFGDVSRAGVVLAALRTDGSLDPGFGEGGRLFAGPEAGTNFEGGESAGGMSVAIGPRDAVVFGGRIHDDFTASVYSPFGYPDPLFGGGTVVVDGGGTDDSDAIAAAPDGGVYMAGSIAHGESSGFAVLRLAADGEPDFGFGRRGVTTVDLSEGWDDADGIAIRPDGRLLVSGTVGDDRLGLMQLEGR